MKQSLKRQQGMSIVTLLFLAAAFVFVVYIGLKVVPIYTDNMTIKKAMASLSEDVSASTINRETVYETLQKRLDINNINVISKEDIHVSQDGGVILVEIDYVDQRELMGNLEVMATFSEQVEVDAR